MNTTLETTPTNAKNLRMYDLIVLGGVVLVVTLPPSPTGESDFVRYGTINTETGGWCQHTVRADTIERVLVRRAVEPPVGKVRGAITVAADDVGAGDTVMVDGFSTLLTWAETMPDGFREFTYIDSCGELQSFAVSPTTLLRVCGDA